VTVTRFVARRADGHLGGGTAGPSPPCSEGHYPGAVRGPLAAANDTRHNNITANLNMRGMAQSGVPASAELRMSAATFTPGEKEHKTPIKATGAAAAAASEDEELCMWLQQKASRRRFSISRRQSTGDVEKEALAAKMSIANRIHEKKQLSAEMKNFRLDTFLDVFDMAFKTAALIIWVNSSPEEQEKADFLVPYVASVAICAAMLVLVLFTRWRQLQEMSFVVRNGYSKRWRTIERVSTDAFGLGKDPRVERDAKERQEVQWKLKTAQAFVSDLPWILINVYRASIYNVTPFVIVSTTVAGFGFGLKFSQMLNLFRRIFITRDTAKAKAMYKRVPADIKICTGVSHAADAAEAVAEAHAQMQGKMGDHVPSLFLIFMTSNHDHEAGLEQLRKIAPGVPYSGATTCMGVIQGRKSMRSNATTVAIWAISDPEGMYTLGVANLDGDTPDAPSSLHHVVEMAERGLRKTMLECREKGKSKTNKGNPVVQGKPSFVWHNCPPGPEDRVLLGFGDALKDVDFIGGSSADNSVAGEWKQWSSATPDTIHSNTVVYVVAHCSAQVQGALQTAYTPSPSVGVVTATNGPRHITTIDHKPAAEVYNKWCQQHFDEAMTQDEANILGPSSIYPLGQVCGMDWDNEPVYRSMHPHLIIKASKSLTLFSDVKVGERVCAMSGTPENLINRVGAVAANIVRESGISTNELRGALVCFCAGVMLYVDKDMDKAAAKLDQALGGIDYIGIHPFGEQGPFPGGNSRHGNLMFSAVTFSSRRRVPKIVNIDTGDELLEGDPKFEDVVMSGGLMP